MSITVIEEHVKKITLAAAELVAAEVENDDWRQRTVSKSFTPSVLDEARAAAAFARARVAREEALDAVRQLAWAQAMLESEVPIDG